MDTTYRRRIPAEVVAEREAIAKAFGIPLGKAFIIHDQITCEIVKKYKQHLAGRKNKNIFELKIQS